MDKDRRYFIEWQTALDKLEDKYGICTEESIEVLEDNLAAMLFVTKATCGINLARVLMKIDQETQYFNKLITGQEIKKKPVN